MCFLNQTMKFENCSNFLLSVAAILKLSSYTQKIPEPLKRPCRRCHVYYLLPTSLKRRTSPIGSSNSHSPPPLPPVPRVEKSQTVDVIQYTVSDWLLFEKSVSPRFDQPLIKRNESFRQENQKTIDLELYRGFTITPNETSHILPLNFKDLNTDNTLRNWLWSTFRLPHAVLPISSGHSHTVPLTRKY